MSVVQIYLSILKKGRRLEEKIKNFTFFTWKEILDLILE